MPSFIKAPHTLPVDMVAVTVLVSGLHKFLYVPPIAFIPEPTNKEYVASLFKPLTEQHGIEAPLPVQYKVAFEGSLLKGHYFQLGAFVRRAHAFIVSVE